MSAVAQKTWRLLAACTGSGIDFYADDDVEVARAKAVCATCAVRAQCLTAGQDEHGIWGGLTESERGLAQRVTARPVCPACGGPTVNVTPTQERCLSCGLAWYS